MTDLAYSAVTPETARQEILAGLCCMPQGLHLMAVLYKHGNIYGPETALFKNAGQVRPYDFRSLCKTINLECRSLQSALKNEFNMKSLWEKFHEVTNLLNTVPPIDDMLVAIAKFVAADPTANIKIVAGTNPYLEALQAHIDCKVAGALEDYELQKNCGLSPRPVKLPVLPLLSAMAQEQAEFGNFEIPSIMSRYVCEDDGSMILNHEQPNSLVERLWETDRHNAKKDLRSRSTKKEEDVFTLLSDTVHERMRAVATALANKIGDENEIAPEKVTNEIAACYLAKRFSKVLSLVQEYLDRTLKGNFIRPNGKLNTISINILEVIGMTAEDAFAQVPFKPSTETENLRRLLSKVRPGISEKNFAL